MYTLCIVEWENLVELITLLDYSSCTPENGILEITQDQAEVESRGQLSLSKIMYEISRNQP